MGRFLVRRSRKCYFFLPFRKLAVKPSHETVNFALVIYLELEISGVVQVLLGDRFKVDFIVLASVGQDILTVNGVDQGLTEDPLLNALH